MNKRPDPKAIDLKAFGAALKQARQSKGIRQSTVVQMVSEFYSDERAFRRIESGARRPEREAIIQIMTKALAEKRAEKIDLLLELAGYESLSDAEVQSLGLRPAPQPGSIKDPEQQPSAPAPVLIDEKVPSNWKRLCLAAPVLTIAAGAVIALRMGVAPAWFLLVTSVLYSALFATSILLETAYQATNLKTYVAASTVFSFVFASSLSALILDIRLVQKDSPDGLWWSLLIFFAAAVVQWVDVRFALSTLPVVPAKFQTLTGQAAHLKNTAYFLLIVVFFWLPPLHSIASLGHEVRMGHTQIVERILRSGPAFVYGGLIYPKPVLLWALLIILIGAAIPMGAHLLDNLLPGPLPSPHMNRFVGLFYLRALLYFALSVLCLLWYSLSMAQLASGELRAMLFPQLGP